MNYPVKITPRLRKLLLLSTIGIAIIVILLVVGIIGGRFFQSFEEERQRDPAYLAINFLDEEEKAVNGYLYINGCTSPDGRLGEDREAYRVYINTGNIYCQLYPRGYNDDVTYYQINYMNFFNEEDKINNPIYPTGPNSLSPLSLQGSTEMTIKFIPGSYSIETKPMSKQLFEAISNWATRATQR